MHLMFCMLASPSRSIDLEWTKALLTCIPQVDAFSLWKNCSDILHHANRQVLVLDQVSRQRRNPLQLAEEYSAKPKVGHPSQHLRKGQSDIPTEKH